MRFGQQCCGNQVVKNAAVCCGNQTVGEVYIPQIGRVCCGSQYIDNKTSLCCVSDTRHSKVGVFIYNTENRTSVVECPLIVWWVIR